MENSQGDVPLDDIVEPGEERAYTAREKALRDYFVEQYLIDYNAQSAAVRVGYNKSMAKEFAAKFMAEPYVLREIQRREGVVDPTKPDDKEAARKKIMAGLLREANFFGPGSSQAARVAALSKLAQLHEMEPKFKQVEEDDDKLKGVIVIPGLMTEEQWMEVAAKQQDSLVAGTIGAHPAPPSIN